MDKEIHFQRLSKAFIFVFKVFNPSQRIFRLRVFILPIWLLLVAISAIQEFDANGIGKLSEFALMFLISTQLLVDSTLSSALFTAWQSAIEHFVEECKSIKRDDEHWELTSNHCRICYSGLIIWWSAVALLLLLSITINFFVPTNEYHLTCSIFITFLPFLGYSFNWVLNYIFQVLMTSCSGAFYASYYLLIFILFNHTAYEVDASILHVKGLNLQIEMSKHGNKLIEERLKGIVEKTKRIQTWQNDVQVLLQYTFMVEFAIVGFILCFALFFFMASPSKSGLVWFGLATCMFLPRLFAYCFMGTRVTVKIEELTAALYDSDWHLMTPKQRKDLQMVIMMAQNMKAFNGVFMPVNLQTFTEVLKFSYTFLAVLKSMN